MVGIIGTEAGLSVQLAARKVQWCVSPIYVLPTGCQPFPNTVFFLLASISSTRQMRRSSWRRTYTVTIQVTVSLWRAMPLLTLRRPLGVYFPSIQHTHRPKTTRGFKPSPRMHRAHSTILRCPKTDQPGPATNYARKAERTLARASCGALLPPYHELLRLHLQ